MKFGTTDHEAVIRLSPLLPQSGHILFILASADYVFVTDIHRRFIANSKPSSREFAIKIGN
ncbi:MAG: hypothetical protein CMM55_02850 [Rhodospirillaceae bacterium]|nr:hypothetical protein [Rhodospirillaceae bacterium]